MFLFKFFGLLDLLVAVLLFLSIPIHPPTRLLLGGALYLIVKGVLFKGDVMSALDLVVGIYCVALLFFSIHWFTILAGSYLFLKGFYSMVA